MSYGPAEVDRSVNALKVSVVKDIRNTTATGSKSAPSSVNVLITATPLLGASARKAVVFSNNDTTNPIYLGKDSNVTTSNGIKLAAGAVFVDEITSDGWYAIASGGTVTVGVLTVT